MITRTLPTRLACCCACFLLLHGVSRALDLTPNPGVIYGNEGAPYPVLNFSDGVKKITWQPPAHWLPDGGGGSLSLTAPGDSGAWMKLIAAPIVKEDPQPVTDPTASADDLQAWAKQYLPSGSQNVDFVKMVPSPFMVCRHPSTEYIFTYVRYGSRGTISISAVDFSATERLVVIFSSSKDFDRVRQGVISSMFTWQYQ